MFGQTATRLIMWGQRPLRDLVPPVIFSGCCNNVGLRRYAAGAASVSRLNSTEISKINIMNRNVLPSVLRSPYIINDANEWKPLVEYTPCSYQEVEIALSTLVQNTATLPLAGEERFLKDFLSVFSMLMDIVTCGKKIETMCAAHALQTGIPIHYIIEDFEMAKTQVEDVWKMLLCISSEKSAQNINEYFKKLKSSLLRVQASKVCEDLQKKSTKEPPLFLALAVLTNSLSVGIQELVTGLLGMFLYISSLSPSISHDRLRQALLLWRPHEECSLAALWLMFYISSAHQEKAKDAPQTKNESALKLDILSTADLGEHLLRPLLNAETLNHKDFGFYLATFSLSSPEADNIDRLCARETRYIKEGEDNDKAMELIPFHYNLRLPETLLLLERDSEEISLRLSIEDILHDCFYPFSRRRASNESLSSPIKFLCTVSHNDQLIKDVLTELKKFLQQHFLQSIGHSLDRSVRVGPLRGPAERELLRELVQNATSSKTSDSVRWQQVLGGFELPLTVAAEAHYYVPCVLFRSVDLKRLKRSSLREQISERCKSVSALTEGVERDYGHCSGRILFVCNLVSENGFTSSDIEDLRRYPGGEFTVVTVK